MNPQTMKHPLRQSIIAARQNLAAVDRAVFSRAITARLITLKAYQSASTVLGYMSFGAEFESGAWVQQALQDGKQVFLPRVNSSSKQLDLYLIKSLQQDLAPGAWDIPEPIPDRCLKVETLAEIDFILLPGVGFARDGSRLGYGGGFYDKLLERVARAQNAQNPPPVLVAAAFSLQLQESIPQEATDRKVEWLLTENEVIDCTTVMNVAGLNNLK